MDVEIIKKDGSSFLLSNHDIYAKDFIVSSIELEPHYNEVENRSGRIDNGATYKARTITVPFYIKAHDLHDYALLRDELFRLVVSRESFYIRELRRAEYQAYEFVEITEPPKDDSGTENRFVGGKIYKVRLANIFELEQLLTIGEGELVFETTELPFAESIGTSADIDNPELLPMVPDLWTQGYYVNIVGGTGTNTNSRSVRMNKKIKVLSGINYAIKNSSSIADLKVSFFNNTGYKRRITIDPTEQIIIEIDNDVIEIGVHFSTSDVSGDDIKPEDIGGTIKGKLTKEISGIVSDDELWGFGMGLIADDDSLIYTHTNTSFKIYNPGIEVHPFEQDLLIEISDVKGSTDYLQLENQTTGDIFKVTEAVNDNQLIKLDGPNVTSNNLQYLRKTNRKYITLAPGWNEFRLTGADSAKVSFDFRFYYL